MGITWCSSVIATIIAVYEIVRVGGFGLASAPVHTTTTCSIPTNYACNTGEISRLSCLMTAKGFGKKVSTLTTTATGKREKTASGSPGAGGGGNAPVTSTPPPTTFGRSGSIQGDVMRKTEKAIRRAMDELRTSRPFVWEALELKKKLTMWQAQTTGLNILQAADLPMKQVQEMKAVEAKLRHLQETHNISDRLLHNIAQEATWDASARVKGERQESVEIPPSAVEHMQAVVTRSEVDSNSRVMDVGAGTGILLRFLQTAGVQHENVFGVDLSSQMVQVASNRYPKANFIQGDFLDYCDRDGAEAGFTHVFFNGCLHNLLEPGEALARAAELLKEGGKIVISHPKGAANVENQRRANPTLVPNRLPTERDLERACEVIPALASKGMRVIPASGQYKGKANEGYLQVLQSFTARA